MTARNNIVSLNHAQGLASGNGNLASSMAGSQTSGGSVTRKMTAPAIEFKELASKQLAKQLQAMFDDVDDALFDLAENAPSNQQQNIFFESMRDVRFKRIEIEKDFLDSLQQDFVAVFSYAELSSYNDERSAADSDADTMSLMDEDVVEEMVAIDTMVAKYDKLLSVSMTALDARLAAMAGVDTSLFTAGQLNNPVAPRRLCNNFSTACRILSVDIKARIVLFKLFEKIVLSGLEQIYQQANEQLIRAGILPDFRTATKRSGANTAATGAANAASDSVASRTPFNSHSRQIDELTQLLNYVPQYVPQFGPGLNAGSAGIDTNALSGAMGMLSASHAPVIGNEVLFQLLSSLQRSNTGSAGQGTQFAPCLETPEDMLLRLVQSLSAATNNSGEHTIGRQERDVIGLVSMLFQFVLEDRVVSGPMKAAISRLQVPIIKVALKEPNFFCSPSHPARLLLNEMTQASVGWVETSDYHKDPLYQSICSAVERITNEFEDDPQIFTEVMADLKSLADSENKRAELRKKRLVDAESGRDESASARDYIQKLLETRVKPGLPAFIRQIVNSLWSNILFLAYLQKGTNSDEWKNALETMDKLLWTVSVERFKDDRTEILASLPALLKSLREGFDSVNYEKSRSSAFFAELEKLHMEVMQRQKPLPIVSIVVENDNVENQPAADVQPASHQQPVQSSATETESASLHAVTSGSKDQSKNTKLAETLSVGQWVEMHEGSSKKRCRLVAILRNSGKRIFVNRSGAKAGEYFVDQIVTMLDAGEMVLLEDAQLFDKALSSIIDGLRRQQKEVVNA